MKQKLWIMYGVLTATTIVVGLLSHSFALTEGVAIAAALAGWTAFLITE